MQINEIRLKVFVDFCSSDKLFVNKILPSASTKSFRPQTAVVHTSVPHIQNFSFSSGEKI